MSDPTEGHSAFDRDIMDAINACLNREQAESRVDPYYRMLASVVDVIRRRDAGEVISVCSQTVYDTNGGSTVCCLVKFSNGRVRVEPAKFMGAFLGMQAAMAAHRDMSI